MALNAASWPAALLPRKVDFFPENQSRSGGLSMTGSEQITLSPAGRWQARAFVSVRGEASNLALRAFVAGMEGRAGTVLVPKWERFRPRNANGRELAQVATAGYGCNEFNFDLSGFGQSDFVHAALASNAAARATQISIKLIDGDGPRPGHYFGMGQRIYRSSAVWQVEEDDPTQVRFWPWLRAADVAGAKVILDRPVCLMRFAQDDTGEAALSRAGSGSVVFDFVEAI